MTESKASSSKPVYAVTKLTTGEKPGDRLDDHIAEEQLRVLLAHGDASHEKPNTED